MRQFKGVFGNVSCPGTCRHAATLSFDWMCQVGGLLGRKAQERIWVPRPRFFEGGIFLRFLSPSPVISNQCETSAPSRTIHVRDEISLRLSSPFPFPLSDF